MAGIALGPVYFPTAIFCSYFGQKSDWKNLVIRHSFLNFHHYQETTELHLMIHSVEKLPQKYDYVALTRVSRQVNQQGR